MPDIVAENIAEILEQRLSMPVSVRNDAHLIAMRERHLMQSPNQNMMYIYYRSGIGAAVFVKGKLYDGDNGNPGYLGHTTFSGSGEMCSCGKKGCLELYCSKNAIEKNYQERAGVKLPFNEILKQSDEGAFVASEVLYEAGKCLGIAVANAVKLLDISLVIVGELACEDDNAFLRSIRNTVNEETSNYAINNIEIRRSSVGDRDYALGACMYVIDKFYNAPKLKLSIA